ncbi:hypothetical protein ERX46_06350 [Brumimicrobium glaciale]|uniref:Uncharacterized protein n=1 Tax=Brumimicrobium glaciale TaxID=200475 RepID=A0A4Q4KPN4_9FLAO|nr:hypothetical protein [Brumimicrobium glaciale]RYM34990.1 hypothetical protein ERX46_06350 [Brumimicrobium glaciale]
MLEIVILVTLSGISFLAFLTVLIFGLVNRNKNLLISALVLFFVVIGLGTWTTYTVINKSFNKISEIMKPRTGEEIYDALFDKRENNCVNVIQYQEQTVPILDAAIWMHFETCPKELERILSKHDFIAERSLTNKQISRIPYDKNSHWFNPKLLGDTIVIYEYSSENHRNIQTIWSNLDSTEVFVRDVLN